MKQNGGGKKWNGDFEKRPLKKKKIPFKELGVAESRFGNFLVSIVKTKAAAEAPVRRPQPIPPPLPGHRSLPAGRTTAGPRLISTRPGRPDPGPRANFCRSVEARRPGGLPSIAGGVAIATGLAGMAGATGRSDATS